MAEAIDRHLLMDLLRKWETGVFDEGQVHIEAESLWESGGEWPIYPKDDARSVGIEVLSNLDIMNQAFIGRDDIPAIRRFLQTPAGSELDAWKTWESYWDKIDFGDREKALGPNGYCRHA